MNEARNEIGGWLLVFWVGTLLGTLWQVGKGLSFGALEVMNESITIGTIGAGIAGFMVVVFNGWMLIALIQKPPYVFKLVGTLLVVDFVFSPVASLERPWSSCEVLPPTRSILITLTPLTLWRLFIAFIRPGGRNDYP